MNAFQHAKLKFVADWLVVGMISNKLRIINQNRQIFELTDCILVVLDKHETYTKVSTCLCYLLELLYLEILKTFHERFVHFQIVFEVKFLQCFAIESVTV